MLSTDFTVRVAMAMVKSRLRVCHLIKFLRFHSPEATWG